MQSSQTTQSYATEITPIETPDDNIRISLVGSDQSGIEALKLFKRLASRAYEDRLGKITSGLFHNNTGANDIGGGLETFNQEANQELQHLRRNPKAKAVYDWAKGIIDAEAEHLESIGQPTFAPKAQVDLTSDKLVLSWEASWRRDGRKVAIEFDIGEDERITGGTLKWVTGTGKPSRFIDSVLNGAIKASEQESGYSSPVHNDSKPIKSRFAEKLAAARVNKGVTEVGG